MLRLLDVVCAIFPLTTYVLLTEGQQLCQSASENNSEKHPQNWTKKDCELKSEEGGGWIRRFLPDAKAGINE